MGKAFTRGRQRDILGYFYQHSGKDITIEELEKTFKGKYVRTDIMSTLANVLAKRSPETQNIPLTRLTTGVWRLESNMVADSFGEPPQQDGNVKMLLVEVLKERDTHLIVEDPEDGKIYKMILVG